MTVDFWADYWWWWLVLVASSWLVAEIASIWFAHRCGATHVSEWTLSDTIRRWSQTRTWLAFVVMLVTVFLLWHFFVELNPT